MIQYINEGHQTFLTHKGSSEISNIFNMAMSDTSPYRVLIMALVIPKLVHMFLIVNTIKLISARGFTFCIIRMAGKI
jgi:hypothetical protein